MGLDKSTYQTVFLQHILAFTSTNNFQNPKVNAVFSEDRITWLDYNFLSLVLFCLFCFGFIGPCSFLVGERKSENMNTFSVQSFILFLMAYSDSPCNCCYQVTDWENTVWKHLFLWFLSEWFKNVKSGNDQRRWILSRHSAEGTWLRDCYLQN